MPNLLSFEVEFSKDELKKIIDDSTVDSVVISGTYEKITGGWDLSAQAQGYDGTKSSGPAVAAKCIRPCP